jgi:hypothetical protein
MDKPNPNNYLNHGYHTHVTHKHRRKGGVLPIQETNKRKRREESKKVNKSVARHETRTLRLLTQHRNHTIQQNETSLLDSTPKMTRHRR